MKGFTCDIELSDIFMWAAIGSLVLCLIGRIIIPIIPLSHSIPSGEYTCVEREKEDNYLTLIYEDEEGNRYTEKYNILVEKEYLNVIKGDEVTLPLEG